MVLPRLRNYRRLNTLAFILGDNEGRVYLFALFIKSTFFALLVMQDKAAWFNTTKCSISV